MITIIKNVNNINNNWLKTPPISHFEKDSVGFLEIRALQVKAKHHGIPRKKKRVLFFLLSYDFSIFGDDLKGKFHGAFDLFC